MKAKPLWVLDFIKSVDFFSSHEALILEYEKALTRIDSRTGNPYDVSGHFIWIGERTRQLDGAHVDFASKVRNPIGIKLGPKSTVDDALALIDKLGVWTGSEEEFQLFIPRFKLLLPTKMHI